MAKQKEKGINVVADYNRRRKIEVFSNYGTSCVCCGETSIEFLAIDHIGGGGNEHRRSIGIKGGQSFYAWLKRNNYPTGYQVLCHNCNMAKGFYGYCPHESVDRKAE